ncbi:MAG TPA: T9SS type A sorting domain-containing protein [Ignavibacteria bacterium]|nr:T9SS type A sorting domain-containing protein [Ignavibacteria bacterium]
MRHYSSIKTRSSLCFMLSAVLLFLFTFNLRLIAQDKSGVDIPAQFNYSTSNTGSTSEPMMTSLQPGEQQFAPEKRSLLDQLRNARLNNDLVKAEELRTTLDQLDGLTAYVPQENNDPSNNPIREKFVTMNVKPPFVYEGDFSVSTISSAGIWAVATASSNRSTAIFAATTEYVSGAGDNVKIFVSYNGGATWNLKYTYNGFASGVDCRAGELDIEPIISGSDTLVYCAVGINYNSHAWSTMIVANIGTGAGSGATWSFGGYLSANVNYYNPKVTSDNTTYSNASYIYMTSSFDSAGTTRYTTRYLLVTSPFTTSPTYIYRQPNAPNGFWWQSNGLTPNTYLHQDICYYNTGSVDRIYTVYNHAGTATDKRVYIAWSNDYGVTVGAGNTLTLTETNNILSAVCAANGGIGRQTVAIGYRMLYSAGDWDYRIQYSPSGGTSSGVFTGQYMEYTSDTSKLISLQAVDLANGKFVTGNAMNGGEHYYRSFNGTAVGTIYQTNNIPGDFSYGGCRAGYWNSTNPDSCVVVWSPNLGAGALCSRLICSTVGIQNNGNGVPSEFSLKQNYPNPFNPVTNIKFSIPRSSFVKITVFDITGKEIAKIVNENMNAGTYTVDFNASNLATGVYLYRIDAEGFTDVKKMMLIK